jgi:hypothetical protein
VIKPNRQQPNNQSQSLATPLTLHQETIAGKKSTEPTSGRGGNSKQQVQDQKITQILDSSKQQSIQEL